MDSQPPCELCTRYNKECTFVESPAKRRRPNDGNAEFGDGNAASDDDSMDDFDEGDGYDAHAHYDDLSLKCDWDDGDDDRDRGILVNVNEGDGGEDDGGEKIDVPRKD